MTNPLFELLKQSDHWQQALASCQSRGKAALYDVTEAQRAFLAAALSRQLRKMVLYIAPSEQAALRAAEDCASLLGGRAALLPAPEVQFLRAVSGRENIWQRLSVLQRARAGELDVLCVSAETMLSRLMPSSALEGLTLGRGQTWEPQALLSCLAQIGYERVEMVEGKGQCALRGDILDVFPPDSDQPARIEFFDTQLDTMRGFDILTQRSSGQLDRLHVGPALEYYLQPEQREQAFQRMREAIQGALSAQPGMQQHYTLAQQDGESEAPYGGLSIGLNRLMRDAQELRDSGSFPAMPLWANIVLPDAVNLLELLNDPFVVIDTPDRVHSRMQDRNTGFFEDLNLALSRADAVPRQQHLLYSADEVFLRLAKAPLLILEELLRGMAGLLPDLVLPLKGKGLSGYQGRMAELSRDIKAWMKNGYSIAVLCSGEARKERMQRALHEFGCPVSIWQTDGALINPGLPTLITLPYSHGFLIQDAGLALLSDTDIFGAGHKKQKALSSAGERIEAFTDLSAGDYVVHEHHGVGVYQGTVRLQSEGAWRDYLFIQYRGNDKLYVPLDQFDRVQKYIGAGDATPQLNDLGSGEWSKQKSKVKSGLQKLAFDLLNLYAQRQSGEGFSFPSQKAFEAQFNDNFEYELTPDQQQAVQDVLGDMEKPTNMDRLLCGDVGYGKTEVAMRAAFRAVINSKQTAFLAPTTILVQQHFRTLTKRFDGFPVSIDFVSRFRSAKANKETIARAAAGRNRYPGRHAQAALQGCPLQGPWSAHRGRRAAFRRGPQGKHQEHQEDRRCADLVSDAYPPHPAHEHGGGAGPEFAGDPARGTLSGADLCGGLP